VINFCISALRPSIIFDRLFHGIRLTKPWKRYSRSEAVCSSLKIISDTVEIIESHTSRGPVVSLYPPSLVNWNSIGTLAAMFAITTYTAPQLLGAGALRFYTRTRDVEDFVFRMRKVVGMCWEIGKQIEYSWLPWFTTQRPLAPNEHLLQN
jgi:hypothetical protein